ncbi:MAG: 1-phosphofructokinase family hexose kinase [Firmicutes bacterium]|nr:1-phosphofructokinase family hexose kinase [Bacillota bacterium]
MIATVTPNPCIDKFCETGLLTPGTLVRIGSVRRQPAGKGIDVALALGSLGLPSLALGFAAGEAGKFIERELALRGIGSRFTWIPGETRTNTKLIERNTRRCTELNEPGPTVTQEDTERLEKDLGSAVSPGDTVVVAGSVPPGAGPELYPRLIRAARDEGARVVLDADGPGFRQGLAAGPFMVKPNEREASEFLGREIRTLKEAAQGAAMLLEMFSAGGLCIAAVSMGPLGAVFATRDESWGAIPPDIEPISPVGCGDALVAGAILAITEQMCLRDLARLAVAAGSQAALRESEYPARALVNEMLPRIRLEQFTMP